MIWWIIKGIGMLFYVPPKEPVPESEKTCLKGWHDWNLRYEKLDWRMKSSRTKILTCKRCGKEVETFED